MKKLFIIAASTMFVASGSMVAMAATGHELFKQHCAVCHPDGGNIIKPNLTLHKKEMAKAGIKDAKGIIKVMRNPNPGMTKFDSKTISDKDAKLIADYILKTFK